MKFKYNNPAKGWLKKITFVILGCAACGIANAQQKSKNKAVLPKPAVYDQLHSISQIKLGNYVGSKLDLAYHNRILAQDINRLIEPFKHRDEAWCWQSEFWGKWFTSAVLAYQYNPTQALKSKLDSAVAGLLATQTADGYIGNYAADKQLEQWDIWGRKYCMLGLLSYYKITQDGKSLAAAEKIAGHLIAQLVQKNALIVKKGNHRGMAASSVLEPIVLLYNATGKTAYLDFAKEIVRQWETPDGPQLVSKADIPVAQRFPKPEKNWFGWEQGQKAYEMMSCYEGLLELYRVTGNEAYKKAVEKTWQSILDTEINIAGSGAAVECWFGGKALQAAPISHYQETCVTATWIKLSQQLLRLTGEAKYAEAIEQCFYNALLGSMAPDGSDWTKYTPLAGKRIQGEDQCKMGINCCVASGPRGLFVFPQAVVMQYNEGAYINFYGQGNSSFISPGKQTVQLEESTSYPVSGEVKIVVSVDKPEEFVLQLRIPQWSQQTKVIVNGEEVSGWSVGTYAAISRKWKRGDNIVLKFDMRGRLVKLGGSTSYAAIVRGPITLTRDARLPGPHVDETIVPVTDKDGFIQLDMVAAKKDNIWMEFKAPFVAETSRSGTGAQTEAIFCDYASAGNTYNDSSWFRVWIPQWYNPRK